MSNQNNRRRTLEQVPRVESYIRDTEPDFSLIIQYSVNREQGVESMAKRNIRLQTEQFGRCDVGVQASPDVQLIQWERKKLRIQGTLRTSKPWQKEEGAFYQSGTETQTENPKGKKHTQTNEKDLRSRKLKTLKPREWKRCTTPEPYIPPVITKPKDKPRIKTIIKVQIPLEKIDLPEIVELAELQTTISKAESEVKQLQQQLGSIEGQREIIQTSMQDLDTTLTKVQDTAGYATETPDEEEDHDILVITGGFDEELFNIERSM